AVTNIRQVMIVQIVLAKIIRLPAVLNKLPDRTEKRTIYLLQNHHECPVRKFPLSLSGSF
ncbi:MAG: hypothetical protein U1C55_08350, partial [Smithellaceae bacterium]|nr:hypothetical protein [Smithellaceae bacterium]